MHIYIYYSNGILLSTKFVIRFIMFSRQCLFRKSKLKCNTSMQLELYDLTKCNFNTKKFHYILNYAPFLFWGMRF